jgi:integrase
MNQNHFITINLQQQKRLLQSTLSKKYQIIILLMLDCGLRVSELILLHLLETDKNSIAKTIYEKQLNKND